MSIQAIEFTELEQKITGEGGLLNGNYDVIKNLNVHLKVVIGEAEILVDELFKLDKGSVLKLNRDAAAPVDIVLDDKVVARGTLVAVDDNFGVKITEIGS